MTRMPSARDFEAPCPAKRLGSFGAGPRPAMTITSRAGGTRSRAAPRDESSCVAVKDQLDRLLRLRNQRTRLGIPVNNFEQSRHTNKRLRELARLITHVILNSGRELLHQDRILRHRLSQPLRTRNPALKNTHGTTSSEKSQTQALRQP